MGELIRQQALTQLYIFLENPCSLACRNCPVSLPAPNGGGHSLPQEAIFQAIDQAIPLGLQTVRLTGGEAFLYPGFDALLDRLESQELHVTLETSGAGLTAGRAARVARLPQSRVIVGLDDSGPITQDTSNNPSSAFDIATHAIRELSAAGLSPHVNLPVTRHNYGQLRKTIHLLEMLGTASIHFTLPQPNHPAGLPSGKNGSSPSASRAEFLSVEEMIALARKIERELANTTRLRLSVDLPPAFRGLHPLARVEGQGRCAVLNNLAVLPTGEFTLCGGTANIPGLVLGQAGIDSLEQVWDKHPILTELREALPGRLEGICGRCIMKTACLGFCAVENYLRAGAFWEPHVFCQSAEIVGLFPAGRLIENLLW